MSATTPSVAEGDILQIAMPTAAAASRVHNRTKHIDAISEDQIIVLQDTCRKIVPPNITQCPLCSCPLCSCPLCSWPQDEEAIPDAVANLEHVGNCIHEFSLYALPWAESLVVDATDPSNPALREKVEEWLKITEEKESADIQNINIKTFVFFPTQPLPIKQEWAYIPEEYFAESSKESSQVEYGSLSLDFDQPEARETYSDGISDQTSEESVRDQIVENLLGSTAAEPPNRIEDYTIGWISFLDIEYVAAQEFLDDEHEGPKWVHQKDENYYTLGRIGKHNVVIAALPRGENGVAAAAMVVKDMMYTFPNVRQNDSERRFQGARYLTRPPIYLLTAVTGLRRKHEIEGNDIDTTINNILQTNQRLQKEYGRPDLGSDNLYSSDPVQTLDAGENLASKLIERPERSEIEDNLAIHYGLIASADGFIKDAQIRDILAEEFDVLCFETEVAGLMDSFPCLVIRGICDYSDRHRFKKWQGYAAMAAAAYAKALLEMLPVSNIDKMQIIKADPEEALERQVKELADRENIWVQAERDKKFVNGDDSPLHEAERTAKHQQRMSHADADDDEAAERQRRHEERHAATAAEEEDDEAAERRHKRAAIHATKAAGIEVNEAAERQHRREGRRAAERRRRRELL
ncbi:hypothetical protein ACHAQJ_003493 [Trichoderma viride]